MFKLKDEESIEFDNMSEFEDDVYIISYPLATPWSNPLGEGESPEAIEKLLATSTENCTEAQMRQAHENLATMTDTFMDPSVPLIDTNAEAHNINIGSTRPIS